ncbi:MAG: alpha/beta fold hydrolase, partial [Phycisphaerales bacterium]|nr:alpha/beta fold hydrolase [Phycisphaerales bacterium]
AVDSRGHGESGGELITYGLLERADVIRWAAWLRGRGCVRIYGLGESMGGAILIQAAAEEPIFEAIVAECAFRDLPTIAEQRIEQNLPGPRMLRAAAAKLIVSSSLLYARARYDVDLRRVAPVESVTRMRTPVLLIHGISDTNTPPAHSQAIAAVGPAVVLWLVPGAEHTTAAARAPAEFRKRVLSWFERNGAR